MISIKLASYNLKRLYRHKWLRVTAPVLPIVAGLLALLLVGKGLIYAATLVPVAFAALIAAVLHAQWCTDAVCGLTDGLKSSPAGPRAVAASRLISGALIVVLQTLVFEAILIVRL